MDDFSYSLLQGDLFTGALFIQQSLRWDLYLSIFILVFITGLMTITGRNDMNSNGNIFFSQSHVLYPTSKWPNNVLFSASRWTDSCNLHRFYPGIPHGRRWTNPYGTG